MTTDPIQLLINAGALPAESFAANSRYRGLALALYQAGPEVQAQAYVRRRFIPQRRDIAIAAEHIVQAGERPELLAAQTLGEPELYWRLADANNVSAPHELTLTLGAHILIPLPPGF
ncbi:nucleoid-associated protein YgaU [Paucibacter oligotrophus]|uniref:Nucleoid-associated protein YgaU n=1 Tax=Roseateles oligotrophus TaxID=1769250 RepID=A0A840LC71_9BURK|nr:Base plate wedge protein 53 [Roseateles oligotrophus]MBB4842917.1 nucleoid-associated protein YgaU [Roseateles oligotrophus]